MAGVEIKQVGTRGERRAFLTLPWRDSGIGFFECVANDVVCDNQFIKGQGENEAEGNWRPSSP